MSQRIPVQQIDPKVTAKAPSSFGKSIVTRSYQGLFRNIRLYSTAALLALFFLTAWLDWDDRQAVLWDLAGGKFYIFGATFWPQDLILLSALLIICAFGLFFLTVLAGRIWCGYSCPQSVWTWIFLRIEHLTEGERHQRIKLDAAPWSWQKILRRTAKHSLWLIVSAVTALTFVGYFTPIRELSLDLLNFSVGGLSLFWLAFFTSATYISAGWLREQVCLHMCPYSRFQSVMFDDSTLLVSYDAQRGENRGARKKASDPKALNLGDCIDCTLCVQVCPTGIDIRDGLQLACISCGACVDVCNDVMQQMGYAPNLISYTSERALAGQSTQWLRPRLLGYAATLILMLGGLYWGLENRSLVSLDVSKDRLMFRENNAGQIENMYMLKIINKTQTSQEYQISMQGSDSLSLSAPNKVHLSAGEIATV
nr:cytochrome c oxidase accessory protein CcoG [Thiopseudomonas sp.]